MFLPNLLFEDELDCRVSRVSAAARRVVAELGPLMGLLSASGASDEFVVVPDNGAPEDLPPALEMSVSSRQQLSADIARFVLNFVRGDGATKPFSSVAAWDSTSSLRIPMSFGKSTAGNSLRRLMIVWMGLQPRDFLGHSADPSTKLRMRCRSSRLTDTLTGLSNHCLLYTSPSPRD